MKKIGYRSGLVAAGIGLALIAGAASRASAAAVVLGNFNLKADGYAVLTPTGGSSEKVDIEGIGQLVTSSAGSLLGAETFSSVDSTAATADVCTGTVSGNIFPPAGVFASGSGDFSMSLNFAPTSGGATCIPSTTTLSCSRALLHVNNAGNLAAGEYRCIATGMTAGTGAAAAVNGVSLRVEFTQTRGTNSPTD